MRWLRRLLIALAALALLLALGFWWLVIGRHAAAFAPAPEVTARAVRAALGTSIAAAAAAAASKPAVAPQARIQWELTALKNPNAEFLDKAGVCLDAALAGDAEGAWCLEHLKRDCAVRDLKPGQEPTKELEARLEKAGAGSSLGRFYRDTLERCRRYWALPPEKTLTEAQRVELLIGKSHPLGLVAAVVGDLPVILDRETQVTFITRAWESGDYRAMMQIDALSRQLPERAEQQLEATRSPTLDDDTLALSYSILLCRLEGNCDQRSPELDAYCSHLAQSYGGACPIHVSRDHMLRLLNSPSDYRIAEAAAQAMQPYFANRDPSWPPLVAYLEWLKNNDARSTAK